MGAKTGIQWTRSTVNPIIARRRDTGKLGFHCVKVSPGCAHCYAELFNLRNLPERGTALPYVEASEPEIEIVLQRDALDQVLSWREPRRIFWGSMTDLFGKFVSSPMIQEMLDVAVRAGEERGHISQFLTKRPERLAAEVGIWFARSGRPLPACVWPGFSAENRRLFLERWVLARGLFLEGLALGPLWLSYEPAVEPLVWAERGDMELAMWRAIREDGLRWIIWGGESGAEARPFDTRWAVDLVRFAGPAGIAIFGKQFGSRAFCPLYPDEVRDEGDHQEVLESFLDRPGHRIVSDGVRWRKRDGQPPPGSFVQARFGNKGGDHFEDWPEVLRQRQFPEGAER